MHARLEALDALCGLRTVIEGLPGLALSARSAAMRRWRDHEDRLRAVLPALGLSDGHAAETAARLLWCRLHMLSLAGTAEPLATTPDGIVAQDIALNALAVVALVIRGAELDGGADATP